MSVSNNNKKSIIIRESKASFSRIILTGFVSLTLGVTLSLSSLPTYADAIGPLSQQDRAKEAFKLRLKAAEKNFSEKLPAHPHNKDEVKFNNKINSYTKGLPHDSNGIVDDDAYEALLKALKSGKNKDFDGIPMGVGDLKLRNPQAAYSYFLEGKDSHTFKMPKAPGFSSAYQASEAMEVMWQALTRDVSFVDYNNDSTIQDAADDMSNMSDFRGPKHNGAVTPQTLFRGIGVGETNGPYISQFLLQPIPYGAMTVEQKFNVPVDGNDHLTDYAEWLNIQRGGAASGITTVEFQDEPRYLYNGRALAQYVLKDFVSQGYLGATRIIRGYGSAAYDPNDPYKGAAAEARSPLFGNNHALDFIGRVSMGSQNVAWFQKWLVHRRARPEVFFGRVHNHLTKPSIFYPIHKDVLNSPAMALVKEKFDSYLLPTATPVGSPLHPTYPAGHAVMAGAAVTMLKAFFNGDFVIPNPVMPNADGTALVPYVAPVGEAPLTIDGELNKLGSNISIGRDTAGVHYRGDGDHGMALGEKYAISVLRELVKTYNEDFNGFTLNKFNGNSILISNKGITKLN